MDIHEINRALRDWLMNIQEQGVQPDGIVVIIIKSHGNYRGDALLGYRIDGEGASNGLIVNHLSIFDRLKSHLRGIKIYLLVDACFFGRSVRTIPSKT